MGNYASFSAKNDDCSWYSTCNMESLMKVGAGYESQVMHPAPPAADDSLYAMPYIKDGAKGMLLVNKKATGCSVVVSGAKGGNAIVVEGTGATPGLNPPIARQIAPDGSLELGPFGVAVVTRLEL
jgi:hypothetical protein